MNLKILTPPRFNSDWLEERFESQIYNFTFYSNIPPVIIMNFDKFDEDHAYLKSCGGCYDIKERTILINHQCSTPLATLFHEFGHHLYQNILNGYQLHSWENYYYKHFKHIRCDKFLKKYRYFQEDDYERNIPPKIFNLMKFFEMYRKNECFTKLETYYAPDKEEAFCEVFASYIVNGECLHKSNTKIMKGILESYENRTI